MKDRGSMRLMPGEGVWFDFEIDDEGEIDAAAQEARGAAVRHGGGDADDSRVGGGGGTTAAPLLRAVRVTGPGGAPVRCVCPGAVEAAAAVAAAGKAKAHEVRRWQHHGTSARAGTHEEMTSPCRVVKRAGEPFLEPLVHTQSCSLESSAALRSFLLSCRLPYL